VFAGHGGWSLLNVTFYGVRGSTPCSCPGTAIYGGNTACVALEVPGEDPIVLDIGTGLRFFGLTQPKDGTFRGHALVSHLHWDHVQGLPFFEPGLVAGSRFDIYAPPLPDGSPVATEFERFMRPPLFPVTVDDVPGTIEFHDLDEGTRSIGKAEVMTRAIPHVGRTNGYRVTWEGTTVAYLSDHQQPSDGGHGIDPRALELCDGVDLLIHDAQYTAVEFARKSTWGHCTYEYALWVAKEAGARTLALYHHDPGRDDASLDAQLACLRTAGDRIGVEVVAASEGLTISYGEAVTTSFDSFASAGAAAQAL
jgi:phosphoribosyl 1,2-cyclic phosphodiesterase